MSVFRVFLVIEALQVTVNRRILLWTAYCSLDVIKGVVPKNIPVSRYCEEWAGKKQNKAHLSELNAEECVPDKPCFDL